MAPNELEMPRFFVSVVWGAGYTLPEAKWLEAPSDSRKILASVARRLGVSCYVCGAIARGDNAFVPVNGLRYQWGAFVPLGDESVCFDGHTALPYGMRVTPNGESTYFGNDRRRGADSFLLNVYCDACRRMLNRLGFQSDQTSALILMCMTEAAKPRNKRRAV